MIRPGPRPPSRRATEALVRSHLTELARPPRSIDPYNRPLFRALLAADLAWRTAGPEPERAGTGRALPAGLALVVVVTLLGDIGTLFVSVSVVLVAALPAAVLIAVALGVAAMFLAHQAGRWTALRTDGRPRMHGALVAAGAVAWFGVGAVSALLRLAAPPGGAGGFDDPAAASPAVPVVLAGLLAVLYAANGIAAAMLGHRTAAYPPAARDREVRRRQREAAWSAHLEADTALRLAAVHGSPMSTDIVLSDAADADAGVGALERSGR